MNLATPAFLSGYALEVSSTSAPASVLAFITTIHCAILLLLKHRRHPKGGVTAILIPSVLFTLSPWFLSSPVWLGVVLATHFAWFIACERLLPAAVAAAPVQAPKRNVASAAETRRAPAERPTAPSSAGFQPVPVLAVFSETPEIRTFRLARPEGFTFRPGQFLMVRVSIDGTNHVRCYSISSAPRTSGYLEISVRNQGLVSGFLHATVNPGMSLQVRGPGGTFVYPEGGRPIVLIAGGIGITPLLAMLRHALDAEPSRPVTLILSAKTERHVPFLGDLRLFERRNPHFRLAIALSQGSEHQEFYSGRVDRRLLETVVEHVKESVYLLCGPLPMIEGMAGILGDLGVPKAQVHFEKFEAAVAGARAAVESRVAVPLVAGDSGDAAPASCTVRLERSGRSFVVPPGQTILDAAESAGEELPSMCRAGVCGTCKVRVIKGEVEGEFDEISDEERRQGYVLACVGRPVGNCVLDA